MVVLAASLDDADVRLLDANATLHLLKPDSISFFLFLPFGSNYITGSRNKKQLYEQAIKLPGKCNIFVVVCPLYYLSSAPGCLCPLFLWFDGRF